jgi:hypothetical protein
LTYRITTGGSLICELVDVFEKDNNGGLTEKPRDAERFRNE